MIGVYVLMLLRSWAEEIVIRLLRAAKSVMAPPCTEGAHTTERQMGRTMFRQ